MPGHTWRLLRADPLESIAISRAKWLAADKTVLNLLLVEGQVPGDEPGAEGSGGGGLGENLQGVETDYLNLMNFFSY